MVQWINRQLFSEIRFTLHVSLVSRMPLADFSSSLLGLFDRFFDERLVGLYIEGHHGLTFCKIARDADFF